MNDIRVPTAPGHSSIEEYLGMMAPSVHASTSKVLAVPDADIAVSAVPARKTIILQAKADVWVGIGRSALPNETLLLPANAVTGIDIMSNVVVNLRSAGTGNAEVLVIQLGQMIPQT